LTGITAAAVGMSTNLAVYLGFGRQHPRRVERDRPAASGAGQLVAGGVQPVWLTHIHAIGDATQLAEGLKAALDATAIGRRPPSPAQQPLVDLDVAPVELGALDCSPVAGR
jgi:hypothetical protein